MVIGADSTATLLGPIPRSAASTLRLSPALDFGTLRYVCVAVTYVRLLLRFCDRLLVSEYHFVFVGFLN